MMANRTSSNSQEPLREQCDWASSREILLNDNLD
jgi:hypothetical protein